MLADCFSSFWHSQILQMMTVSASPDVPTIAKKARLSDRQVYTVLRQFREDGILSVLNPGGGRDCSTYRLNFTPEITSGQPCSPLQGTPEICSSVYKEEPSYNRQGSRQKKESSRKTSIPGDFTISPRVRAWATTKGYSLPRGTS